MIVNLFSTGAAGGGDVAARRLTRGLLRNGIEARLWHKPVRGQGVSNDGSGNDSSPLELREKNSNTLKQLRRAVHRFQYKRQLRNRPSDGEIFTLPWSKHQTPYDPKRIGGDLIHLHWVNRWIDWPSFFSSIPDTLPIVWTLHDMNPMTGGCHHADGCDGFERQCGNCPQLHVASRGPLDLSAKILATKRNSYRDKPLYIVTPSDWLCEHARRSTVFESAMEITMIRNGLDVSQFHPVGRLRARQELGLPLDRTIIAFGAASLTNRRKGMPELTRALSGLNARDQVLGIGFGGQQIDSEMMPIPFRSTGFLNTPMELARVYSAADMFVLPSLGENMPQTVVESLACGTPVVAFSVGGVPEVVIHGSTGRLAPLGDCDELGRQIQWMIDHPIQREAMGKQGRMRIVREFDLDQQTRRHIALYQSALSRIDRAKTGRAA